MYDPSEIPANLLPGHLMRKARERKGMNQTQVAEAIGLSQQSVARMELGQHKVLPRHVSLLVSALGIDRDELLHAIQLQAEYSNGDVLHTRPDTVKLQSKVDELEAKVALLIAALQRNDQ